MAIVFWWGKLKGEDHLKKKLHVDGRIILKCILNEGDRGSTVVKVLCYKSESRWFDPSWCQWNFH